MTGNKITEWSYDLPTEQGLYLCCDGDIEVPQSMVYFSLKQDGDNNLHDDNWGYLDQFDGSGFKWARLLIGSDAK